MYMDKTLCVILQLCYGNHSTVVLRSIPITLGMAQWNSERKMDYSKHSAQLQQRKVKLHTLLSTTCLPPEHFVYTRNDS